MHLRNPSALERIPWNGIYLVNSFVFCGRGCSAKDSQLKVSFTTLHIYKLLTLLLASVSVSLCICGLVHQS